MDEGQSLPEDRFNALMGRALRREDRERLAKVRNALGIRANDAVWDVMIALDYHLQLYAAVPKQLAAEREKLVAELDAVARGLGREERGAGRMPVPNRGALQSGPWLSIGQVMAPGATAVAFGGICIAAGFAMAGRGRPPWGAAGPLGAMLGAPAGWLVFLLLLPVAARWVRAGWAAARSHEGFRIRAVGWMVVLGSVSLIVAGLAVLALALRR
jgi:hypothetical protein